MRRLVTVLSMVALGCTEPAPQCSDLPAIATYLPLLRGYAGVSSTHTLKVNCVRPGETPSRVEVSLADPQGNPVPFTVSAPMKGEYDGFTATLEFTPPVPGLYPLTARFEPKLGVLTTQVVVIRDRRTESPSSVISTPETCTSVAAAGAWVGCSGTAKLHVFHDGGLLFEGAPSHMRGADDVLWTWNDLGVARFEGAQRTELTTPIGAQAAGVSATRDTLVLAALGDLVEVSFSNGTLARRVLLADAGVTSAVVPVEGGWVSATGRNVCFISPNASPQCTQWERRIIGPERNGFWVEGTGGPSDVGFFGYGPSPQPTLSVELSLSIDWLSQPLARSVSGGLPVFNGSTTVRADTFTLEEWPPSTQLRVTPSHVFGVEPRSVSVFER